MPGSQVPTDSQGDRLLLSFIHELDTQGTWAEIAYTALVMALSERVAGDIERHTHEWRVFFYAQAFLTHAAVIATILRPPADVDQADIERFGEEAGEALKAMRKERGKRLRTLVGRDA